jgi:amidase
MTKNTSLPEQSFVIKTDIPPYCIGKLDGLTFAVKDLIDLAGLPTGCGNPTWAKTHPPAVAHAVCVEQLLTEGARCIGKTVTDELAFSLIGQNHFYGTPLNPKASNRVPGGSSSGSASAVACGLVDFALGTDTGGSVRVPSSNCGIFGYRPTHGRISLAGVNPFAPTFDTVGVLAKDAETLDRVISVLAPSTATSNEEQKELWILDDIVSICDEDVQEAFQKTVASTQHTTLSNILSVPTTYEEIWEAYVVIQCSEIWSTLGPWVEDQLPEFGPVTHNSFHHIAKNTDRTKIKNWICYREWFAEKIRDFTSKNALLCFPTTPSLAPLIDTVGTSPSARTSGSYYPRALAIDAISGFSRAPQISIPLMNVSGVPIGVSILGEPGTDQTLSKTAYNIALNETGVITI